MPGTTRRSALLALFAAVSPLAGLLVGCSSPDNPTIKTAPPPAPPSAEESQAPKIGNKKTTYGSGERYKKAMDKLNK